MAKYEYDFDILESKLKAFRGLCTEGHQEIIRARAKNGWIYDGWIPTKQLDGNVLEFQLIFRREIPDNE